MCNHDDVEARRARDLERYRRRTAERRAAGLCPGCGKRPPAPNRSRCEPCAAKRRPADRARHRRRAAARIAAGLCPKCGKRPPAPGRSLCAPCNEKTNRASRARDARLRAAGVPRRDPDKARAWERERARRQAEKRRAVGLCTSCGTSPPVEGGAACAPCREKRRESERRTYAARRAAGQCVRCAAPVNDGRTRCAPCAVLESERRDRERKNAWSRELYRRRRARSQCTSCGAPSQGAARCSSCADKSYHGSAWFRGIPVWDPSFTVVERATGETLGTFDSEAEAAAALVFAKLDPSEVEVFSDANPVMRWAAWA